jgi:hypothetical protein
MPWIHRRGRRRWALQNGDFVPEHSTAVWTMLTEGDSYVAGAVLMGASVRKHSVVPLDLVVMELATKPLADVAWVRLQEVGWKKCVVSRITPLAKPRFRDQFTKLHIWKLVQERRPRPEKGVKKKSETTGCQPRACQCTLKYPQT